MEERSRNIRERMPWRRGAEILGRGCLVREGAKITNKKDSRNNKFREEEY